MPAKHQKSKYVDVEADSTSASTSDDEESLSNIEVDVSSTSEDSESPAGAPDAPAAAVLRAPARSMNQDVGKVYPMDRGYKEYKLPYPEYKVYPEYESLQRRGESSSEDESEESSTSYSGFVKGSSEPTSISKYSTESSDEESQSSDKESTDEDIRELLSASSNRGLQSLPRLKTKAHMPPRKKSRTSPEHSYVYVVSSDSMEYVD